MQEKKANGVYYTPQKLADYLVDYIFKKYEFHKEVDILEPSCGDGVFLKSLLNCKKIKTEYIINFNIVEKDNEELLKAISLIENSEANNKKINDYCGDYLDYSKNTKKTYDLIIGNPPYIKRNLLSESQINISSEIIKKAGISKKICMNIWIPFLISSIEKLKENGILCFILPSELLQVEYAKEIRVYLNNNFSIIEIFKFNELIFDGIEQDVVVLIGVKNCIDEGVIFHKLDNLNNLKKKHKIYKHKKTNNKWSEYYLSRKELMVINSVKKESNIKTISDLCYSKVGIVTGANDFFILNNKNAEEYNIEPYLTPIIKKSSYLSKSLIASHEDFDKIKNENKGCFLLNIDDNKTIIKNSNIHKYIIKGEKAEINKKYKCKKRPIWYKVPSVDVSEGMFFKRTHIIPKIIVNDVNALVTDTAYRIYMNKEYNIKSLTFSFYNSLTLMFVELLGRSYGGGVLELTPNEFKALPIPYLDINDEQFRQLDNMLKSSDDIEPILEYTDYILLIKGLGLSEIKVSEIRKIRQKLLMERIKKI